MTSVPQSSSPIGHRPACLLAAAVLFAALPLEAQRPARLTAEATFHKDPGGVRLASLARNTQVAVVRARGEWTEITVEGWIWSRSVGNTTRDGFNLVVSAEAGENLRLQPDGQVVGRAVNGALFHRVRTEGGWTRVRRSGWVASSTLPAVPAAAPAPAPAAAGPPTTTPPPQNPGAARADSANRPAGAAASLESPFPATGLAKGTTLAVVPGGERFAEVTNPADGRVVGRQGEWVRVRLEGWVRAADLTDPRTAEVPRITAADLLRAPERYLGQVVDWRLQFLAVQVADELRPELPQGQPFLLARGPLPEAGFVYVIVTREQVERFRQMAPLDEFEARAVIRAARTRYLANPVIELQGVP